MVLLLIFVFIFFLDHNGCALGLVKTVVAFRVDGTVLHLIHQG